MVVFLAGVQLVPDGSMLFHLVLILLMIFVLNKTFFRPINQILEARDKEKKTNMTEAEALLLEAKKNREKLEAELLQARNKGYEIIEQTRKEALKEAQNKIKEAKEDISRKVAEEKSEIYEQTDKAKKEILAQTKDLAEKISNSVLN